MTDTCDPYTPLFDNPPPPAAISNLLKLLWDAYRTEGWLLNGDWPHGCSAPGEHLTAAGADDGGRWAIHDGERLRAEDSQWLRHMTEVAVTGGTWWRTHWQRWPKHNPQGPTAEEIRIALKRDADDVAPLFHLYAYVDIDGKPHGHPALRTFQDDADPGMPTDAGIELHTNLAVSELLEWVVWLPFDGRRSLAP